MFACVEIENDLCPFARNTACVHGLGAS